MCDFERVLGSFKGSDGGPAMGSAELLEVCNALKPAAVQELQALAHEYELKCADGELPSEDFQE